MSVKVSNWVWQQSCSKGADRLVLLAIADQCDDEGRTMYGDSSQKALSAKTRIPERTLRACLKRLEAIEELVIERASTRTENTYRVLITPAEMAGVTPAAHGRSHRQPTAGHTGSPRPVHKERADVDDVETSAPPAAEALCILLADRIEANGSKRPAVGKAWFDAARLMLDRDGRDPAEAADLIEWCQGHDFWRSNIMSMGKFRTQYDRLRLQAQRGQAKQPWRHPADERMAEIMEALKGGEGAGQLPAAPGGGLDAEARVGLPGRADLDAHPDVVGRGTAGVGPRSGVDREDRGPGFEAPEASQPGDPARSDPDGPGHPSRHPTGPADAGVHRGGEGRSPGRHAVSVRDLLRAPGEGGGHNGGGPAAGSSKPGGNADAGGEGRTRSGKGSTNGGAAEGSRSTGHHRRAQADSRR